MNRIVIFFTFFILILGAGIIILYFSFEKPAQEKIQASVVNLTIFAKDNDNFISTGYIINRDGKLYKSGNTLEDGGIYDSIAVNSSIEIYNINIDNQIYYTDFKKISLFGDTLPPQRIVFNLVKPSDISIMDIQNLENNSIFVDIIGDYLRNISVCYKYSKHFVSTRINEFAQVDKPAEYSLYDKCYDLKQSLINNSMNFTISYNLFGKLDSQDFIDLIIADKDCYNDNCNLFKNGIDLGLPNTKYRIKFINE